MNDDAPLFPVQAAYDLILEAEDRLAELAADQALENAELLAAMDEVLLSLTPREERTIRLRFGIGGGRELTLREVGALYGVGQEATRRIEANALNKLRRTTRARRLRPFYTEQPRYHRKRGERPAAPPRPPKMVPCHELTLRCDGCQGVLRCPSGGFANLRAARRHAARIGWAVNVPRRGHRAHGDFCSACRMKRRIP